MERKKKKISPFLNKGDVVKYLTLILHKKNPNRQDEDLGLHHPPCQEHQRNAGYYALATMAYTLCRGSEMIGGKGTSRGETKRKDGEERKHSTPKYMQIWRFIRRYLTLPGRISYHKREIKVTLLGLCDVIREEFRHYWCNICGC